MVSRRKDWKRVSAESSLISLRPSLHTPPPSSPPRRLNRLTGWTLIVFFFFVFLGGGGWWWSFSFLFFSLLSFLFWVGGCHFLFFLTFSHFIVQRAETIQYWKIPTDDCVILCQTWKTTFFLELQLHQTSVYSEYTWDRKENCWLVNNHYLHNTDVTCPLKTTY